MATDTAFSTSSGSKRTERIRLLVQPVVVVLAVAATLFWAFSRDLDSIEQTNINATSLTTDTWDHLKLSFVVIVLVVVIAVPLGVLLTRRKARWAAPFFLAIATIGQAAPAIGVLVLFFLWSGWEGLWAAALPIALYSLLAGAAQHHRRPATGRPDARRGRPVAWACPRPRCSGASNFPWPYR